MSSEGIRQVEQIEGLTDADYNLISSRIFEFDDKRVSDEHNITMVDLLPVFSSNFSAPALC